MAYLEDGRLLHASLFGAVPDNFFYVLTGRNKSFYAECLLELHEQSIFTDSADFDRQLVNAIINACMDQHNGQLEEEEEPEGDASDPDGQVKLTGKCTLTKELVYYRLKKCGWIEDDFDANHNQLISFTIPALTILPTLKKMAQPSRISLGGYTRNIIDNLLAVKTTRHPYQDAFLLAANNTYAFMQEMAKISMTIRKEIESILDCESFTEMTQLLNAYLDNYLDGDYYKLQFEENLTANDRRRITELLSELESDEEIYSKLVEGAKEHLSLDDDRDAEEHVLRAMETIRSRLCEEYERQYRNILRNQTRYIASANIKISMLMTDKKNTSGAINRIVLALSELPEEELETPTLPWVQELHNTLSLPLALHLKDEGLYKAKTPPRERSTHVEEIPMRAKQTFGAEDIRSCKNSYSASRANKILRQIMGDRPSIHAEELPLNSREDFNQLVSLVLCSEEESSSYSIRFEEGRMQKGQYDSANFRIEKKGQKGGEAGV